MLNCDFLVVGSGQTGIYIATELAEIGFSVILAEQSEIGGSYINSLENPKMILFQKSSAFYESLLLLRKKPNTFEDLINLRASFGSEITSEIEKNKRRTLAKIKKKTKLAFIGGKVSFNSKTMAEINSETDRHLVNFKKCVLAVGKNSLVKPDINGIDKIPLLYQHTAFNLSQVPEKLVILGVSKNSLEIAEIYTKLGIKVTIIEEKQASNCLPEFDRMAADWAIHELEKKKVEFYWETKVKKLEMSKSGPIIVTSEQKITATHIYTDLLEGFEEDGINLAEIGVKYGPAGIVVDKNGLTKAKNVWAFGQCCDEPNELKLKVMVDEFLDTQRKEKNESMHRNIIFNLFGGKGLIGLDFQTESILLQNPVATIGMTETLANATFGPSIKTKIIVSGDDGGALKIIFRSSLDEIHGITILGDFYNKFYDLSIYFLQKKVPASKAIQFFNLYTENSSLK